MNLEPKARAFVDALASAGLPPFETLSPSAVRDLTAKLRPEPRRQPIAEIVDHAVRGPGGDILVRSFRDAADPIAAILFLHAGGWVLGSVAAQDDFCRELAVATGCVVHAVDYRKAPEARYPAALDDCWAALRWLAGETALPIVLLGESAGGQLAAVLAQRARDAGGPKIALQILAEPVTDAAMDTASYREFADGPLLTAPVMAWFWDHYLPDAAARADPAASPLRGYLSGLPPAFVITAENDVLRDEGEAYADALAAAAAGVPVRKQRYAGQIHTFLSMVGAFDGGAAAMADIAAEIRKAVA